MHAERVQDLSLPFPDVATIRSNTAFDFIDLDFIDGNPCLAYTQGRKIAMKDLHTRIVASFTCGPLPNETPEVVSDN